VASGCFSNRQSCHHVHFASLQGSPMHDASVLTTFEDVLAAAALKILQCTMG
jgi:hypothetical protein